MDSNFPCSVLLSTVEIITCSRLSDSRDNAQVKCMRKNTSTWSGKMSGGLIPLPSVLPFYVRVRAFSIFETRLSRSLGQAIEMTSNCSRTFYIRSSIGHFKTRRKLDRVRFCKDFWDRYRGCAIQLLAICLAVAHNSPSARSLCVS